MMKILLLILFTMNANAMTLTTENIVVRVTFLNGGKEYKVNGLIVKPENAKRKLPLVILTHGAPGEARDRKNYVPEMYLPQAKAIAALGYMVASIERRGFGRSAEPFMESPGSCKHRSYMMSAEKTSEDISGAFNYLKKRSDVDPSRIVIAGQSAGGFVMTQFARRNPPGLRGVISFAGGRGSDGHGKVCDLEQLNSVYAESGRDTKVPELWVYADNDKSFGPYFKKWFQLYTASGKATLFEVPSFGDDGHHLFSAKGIPIWIDHVSDFLKSVMK